MGATGRIKSSVFREWSERGGSRGFDYVRGGGGGESKVEHVEGVSTSFNYAAHPGLVSSRAQIGRMLAESTTETLLAPVTRKLLANGGAVAAHFVAGTPG